MRVLAQSNYCVSALLSVMMDGQLRTNYGNF